MNHQDLLVLGEERQRCHTEAVFTGRANPVGQGWVAVRTASNLALKVLVFSCLVLINRLGSIVRI